MNEMPNVLDTNVNLYILASILGECKIYFKMRSEIRFQPAQSQDDQYMPIFGTWTNPFKCMTEPHYKPLC